MKFSSTSKIILTYVVYSYKINNQFVIFWKLINQGISNILNPNIPKKHIL